MIGVLLRHSDAHGDPILGGHLHYIVVSDEGPPPPVDQMTLRGLYPNNDCAVAIVTSCARARRRAYPPATVLERDEGNTGAGASVQGVATGLRACGLGAAVESTTPSGRLWGMNPAGGRELDPDHIAPDLRMAAVGFPGGYFVRVLDPVAVPPGETEMTPDEHNVLWAIANLVKSIADYVGPQGLYGQLNALSAKVDALEAKQSTAGAPTGTAKVSGTLTIEP